MDKVDTKKSTFSETKNVLRSDLSMSSKMKSTSRKLESDLSKNSDVKKMREHLNLQRD